MQARKRNKGNIKDKPHPSHYPQKCVPNAADHERRNITSLAKKTKRKAVHNCTSPAFVVLELLITSLLLQTSRYKSFRCVASQSKSFTRRLPNGDHLHLLSSSSLYQTWQRGTLSVIASHPAVVDKNFVTWRC